MQQVFTFENLYFMSSIENNLNDLIAEGWEIDQFQVISLGNEEYNLVVLCYRDVELQNTADNFSFKEN